MVCDEMAFLRFLQEGMLTPEEKENERDFRKDTEEILHSKEINPYELSKEKLAKVLEQIRQFRDMKKHLGEKQQQQEQQEQQEKRRKKKILLAAQ